MDSELILPIVARWAHILAAVVVVGGLVFVRLILAPAAQATLDEDGRSALRRAITARWKPVVWACIALLLVSGFYNFATISLAKAKEAAVYHPLFGIKFLAALVVFFIASVLVGRSKATEKLRARSPSLLAAAIASAVVVILVSGVLKNL